MQNFNPQIVETLAETVTGWYSETINFMLSDSVTDDIVRKFAIIGDLDSPVLICHDITYLIANYLRGRDLINFATVNRGIRRICWLRTMTRAKNSRTLSITGGWYLGDFYEDLYSLDEVSFARYWHDWTAYDRNSAMCKLLHNIRSDSMRFIRSRITIATGHGRVTLCSTCFRFVSIWVPKKFELEFIWGDCRDCKDINYLEDHNVTMKYTQRGLPISKIYRGDPFNVADIATFAEIITDEAAKKYFNATIC